MSSLQVIILAGGYGRRLEGLFDKRIPKALYPLGGSMRFLDWAIKKTQILDPLSIIFCCGHLSDLVIKYVRNGYPELSSVFYVDKKMKGPIAALQDMYMAGLVTAKNILVIPCDHFFTFSIKRALNHHDERCEDMTFLAVNQKISYCYTVKSGDENASLVGQYIFGQPVFKWLASVRSYHHMTQTLLSYPGKKSTFIFRNKFWEDLGTVERIQRVWKSTYLKKIISSNASK